MRRHRYIARAFDKPEGIASKYICIRQTITARALLHETYEDTRKYATRLIKARQKKEGLLEMKGK